MSGRRPSWGLVPFILSIVLVFTPFSISADPQEFGEQFEKFCLEIDSGALDAFDALQAKLDGLINGLDALKDLDFSLNFDLGQCIDGEFDIGDLPDPSGCFEGIEFPECEWDPEGLGEIHQCISDIFEGFEFDFDIDFDCFQHGFDIPSIQGIAGILANIGSLFGGFGEIIASLQDFQVAFSPDFVFELRTLAEFCDEGPGGFDPGGPGGDVDYLEAINTCGKKRKKKKRRKCYKNQYGISVNW